MQQMRWKLTLAVFWSISPLERGVDGSPRRSPNSITSREILTGISCTLQTFVVIHKLNLDQ